MGISPMVSDLVRTQLPIRIKALGRILKRDFFPPLASQLTPEKLSVPRRVQGFRTFTNPLALPFGGQPHSGSRRGRTIESQHRRVLYVGRGFYPSSCAILISLTPGILTAATAG